MVIEDKRTPTFQITSRNLKSTEATSNEGYQLPTQRYQEEQRNKTGITTVSRHSKQKQTQEQKLKLANKILKLYSTPVEREIPLKRARSVQRKGKNARDVCSSVEGRHWFESSTANGVNSTSSPLQFSRNFVNDYATKGVLMNHLASCPLAAKSRDNDRAIMEEDPWGRQINSKKKILEQIRPRHPAIREEIVAQPRDALKVNGMVLADRLKVLSTPFYKRTPFGNIQQTTCVAPKHWLNYLNEKITKKLTTSSTAPPLCANTLCKLCQLNSEQQHSVEQSNLEKGVLHIDLKRLTQVRSKDWSSYGHFTRVHKLRYTKRQKTDLETEDKEHHVDVDEDYLNVDVDRLMEIYEQKGPCDVDVSKSVFPWQKSDDHGEACSSDKEMTAISNASDTVDGYVSVERPATTSLRSCLNFTSRKTCFTNVYIGSICSKETAFKTW